MPRTNSPTQHIAFAGGPEFARFVQFHEILYSLFRDILYSFRYEISASKQRSTIVDRCFARSSSRTRVRQ